MNKLKSILLVGIIMISCGAMAGTYDKPKLKEFGDGIGFIVEYRTNNMECVSIYVIGQPVVMECIDWRLGK